jgi:integrase
MACVPSGNIVQCGMALSLYRRHRRDCKSGHAEDSRSGEFDERKKTWKRCDCPIFVSGTLLRRFRRQSTGQWEWDLAKPIAAQWEKTGSWDGDSTPPQPMPSKIQSPERVSTDRAIKAFTAEFETHAAINTQKKYRLLLDKLKVFGQDRGYLMLDQWTPIDIRDMRASWKVSQQTAAKSMSTIKAFFEYCVSNEWLARNPARLVKNQRTRDAADKRGEQKEPFSDAEIERMYEACVRSYGKQEIVWSRQVHHHRVKSETARYNRKWSGEDLADFISISVYTGLRISDVCMFRADRLKPTGEILIRTTKAGTHVYTWVPKWLQDRIRTRAKQHGQLIFGEHVTKDMNVITDVWRRKLIKLWALCGPWKETPTPHRFRHTFARILLERGVTVRDVADLLGNSEQIVRKHYGAWVPERQERLTRILREAFDTKPKPTLAAMSKR